jgi:hypothetical protein
MALRCAYDETEGRSRPLTPPRECSSAAAYLGIITVPHLERCRGLSIAACTLEKQPRIPEITKKENNFQEQQHVKGERKRALLTTTIHTHAHTRNTATPFGWLNAYWGWLVIGTRTGTTPRRQGIFVWFAFVFASLGFYYRTEALPEQMNSWVLCSCFC